MSGEGVKRGPYARTLKRREEIADAVLGLVDELGHEAVTTALVSERSSTNEATVLYHFPTKDHLLVAALRRSDEMTAMAAGVADLDDQDVEPDASWLEHLPMALTLTDASEGSPRARLLHVLRGQSTVPGHPAAVYFAEREARTIRIFTRLIAARRDAGLVHPALEPKEVATQFVALWSGLGLLAGVDDTVDVGHLVASGLRMLSGEAIMVAQRALLDLDA